jgi:CRISP-associated protein Cas1
LNRARTFLSPFHAYAALESELRIKAISNGYDPTTGIMDEGRDGSSKFIFDLMEPERAEVDRVVLDFVRGDAFDPADFVIRSDGVCRLDPLMAHMVVAKVSAQKIFDRDRPEST